MATQLKNMGHAALTCNSVALRRAALNVASSRQRLAARNGHAAATRSPTRAL